MLSSHGPGLGHLGLASELYRPRSAQPVELIKSGHQGLIPFRISGFIKHIPLALHGKV